MRPGFTFLTGPDSALLKEEMERQIAANLPPGEDWKRHIFWGDEEPGDAFWEALGQVGLFSDRRLVIVRKAESWTAEIWKELSRILAREMAFVWPFFYLEVGVEKGKFKIPAYIEKLRCFGFASKKGWIWRNQGLDRNLSSFVRAQAKSLGLRFSAETLTAFCSVCPPDANGVLNELRKLALVAKDGEITADLLSRTGAPQESDAFALVRKIMNRDLAGVWQEIEADTDGSLLFFAIALLAREFRTLWQISVGETPRMYPAEAARKRSLALRLGAAGISAGLTTLAEAEWKVKSGQVTPLQALEALCGQMINLPDAGNCQQL